MSNSNNTPTNSLYVQSNGTSSSSTFVDIFQPRNPTANDLGPPYKTQQKWLNTQTGAYWILKGFTSVGGPLQAVWSEITEISTAAINTVQGDIGGEISPTVGGNLFLLGDGFSITTVGTLVNNTVTFSLLNYSNQTTTTANATPNTVMFINLGAIAGVYTFDINTSAFNASTPAGAGYSLFGTVRTNGTTATLIGVPDKIINQEMTLATTDVDLIVSGNSAIIQVTGAAGLNIDWRAIIFYTFVS